MLVKLGLEKQRDMDKMFVDQTREIEVNQEKQDAEIIAAKHLESRQVKQAQR